MLNQRFIFTFLILILVSSCTISPPPPIMTDEKFESRINSQGQTEFIYGLSWRNTSRESLLGDRPEPTKQFSGKQQGNGREKGGKRDRLPEQHNLFNLQADNQTKLELEDKAAASLKKRLIKEQLCPNGYEINKVVWKTDNLRLLGYCL
ncbi:hypothetical protein L0668_16975 [Paraglaciecola aquimarina]|uniref:Lipoprotein n=1 Tax=Paraglaciecola algarum TaxID=3050085 RepID=A0ABS9DA58_9ALTE|nr:hypothetical protein [Paraglaciecola sp. G1-23]MCF2949814.1 hypothetical protein [Paraglaciecola sp. G1-23]